jgi:hypothetical protein
MAVGEIFERLHFPMLLPRVAGGLSPPTTVGLSNSSSTYWTDGREYVGDRHDDFAAAAFVLCVGKKLYFCIKFFKFPH